MSLLEEGTEQSWTQALDIYEQGAHSKSVATVKLDKPVGTLLKKGTDVIGFSGGDLIREVRGSLLEDVEATSFTLQIQYDTSSIQSRYNDCQVGGNPDPNIDGCKLMQFLILDHHCLISVMADGKFYEKYIECCALLGGAFVTWILCLSRFAMHN